MWGRRLSSLVNSPTFPYELHGARKRLPQLGGGTDAVRNLYMAGIMNSQMMVNGFVVRKKVK